MPQTRKAKKAQNDVSPKPNKKTEKSVAKDKMETQNVNSNHMSLQKRLKSADVSTLIKVERLKASEKNKTSSHSQMTEADTVMRSNNESDEEQPTDKTQFNEDGEVMVMEINDGGVAAQEFASESEDSEDSNSDSERSSDDETGFVSDGKIIDENEDAEWMREDEDSQASNNLSLQDDETNEHLCKDKKKKKKAKRKSMEDKIDTIKSNNSY